MSVSFTLFILLYNLFMAFFIDGLRFVELDGWMLLSLTVWIGLSIELFLVVFSYSVLCKMLGPCLTRKIVGIVIFGSLTLSCERPMLLSISTSFALCPGSSFIYWFEAESMSDCTSYLSFFGWARYPLTFISRSYCCKPNCLKAYETWELLVWSADRWASVGCLVGVMFRSLTTILLAVLILLLCILCLRDYSHLFIYIQLYLSIARLVLSDDLLHGCVQICRLQAEELASSRPLALLSVHPSKTCPRHLFGYHPLRMVLHPAPAHFWIQLNPRDVLNWIQDGLVRLLFSLMLFWAIAAIIASPSFDE